MSCVLKSVHVDGVEDPLGELLQLGSGGLRLVLQPLVVLPQPLDLSLKTQFLFSLLWDSDRSGGSSPHRSTPVNIQANKVGSVQSEGL